MHNPLIEDLIRQRPAFMKFVRNAVALVTLLFLIDSVIHHVLVRGLTAYFGVSGSPVVACIGHSRTVLGVSRPQLEESLGVEVAKYAVQGAASGDRFAMLRHLVARSSGSLKVVVFDVSAYSFNDHDLSSNSYTLFFPFLEEPEIGDHVASECQSWAELRLRQVVKSARYTEPSLALALRGLLGVEDNLKWGSVDEELIRSRIRTGRSQSMGVSAGAVRAFDKMVNYALDRNVEVVLAYIPTIDIASDADRESHDHVIGVLREYAQRRPHVHFFDYNSKYESRYDLFYDPIHLNAKGQELITQELSEDLVSLLTERKPVTKHAGAAAQGHSSPLEVEEI